MRSSRGVVLLIGAAVVLALFAISRSNGFLAASTQGTILSAPPETVIIQQPPTATVPPAVASESTSLPESTPTSQSGEPTATPQLFSADELQTIIPLSTPGTPDANTGGWNPPPLEVPIARHPFDHYWLIRPVGSNYTNYGLEYYPYGSDGPRNDLRIHHGIDLANPIGVEVYAAGAGTVIWADKGHLNEYESITAYGNTVVIQHDFGYHGETVYTLYAHLSAMVVTAGQHVQAGDIIGLIGNTGQVTGPHVHFEVRVGRDSYFAVRNPELWMAPYVDTGIVAGRIAFPNGGEVDDAVITLIDRDTGRVVRRTTSYAGFGVVADDNWNENFVFGDVPTGRYLVTSRFENLLWSGEVTVVPGATNWVELESYIPEDGGIPQPSP